MRYNVEVVMAANQLATPVLAPEAELAGAPFEQEQAVYEQPSLISRFVERVDAARDSITSSPLAYKLGALGASALTAAGGASLISPDVARGDQAFTPDGLTAESYHDSTEVTSFSVGRSKAKIDVERIDASTARAINDNLYFPTNGDHAQAKTFVGWLGGDAPLKFNVSPTSSGNSISGNAECVGENSDGVREVYTQVRSEQDNATILPELDKEFVVANCGVFGSSKYLLDAEGLQASIDEQVGVPVAASVGVNESNFGSVSRESLKPQKGIAKIAFTKINEHSLKMVKVVVSQGKVLLNKFFYGKKR